MGNNFTMPQFGNFAQNMWNSGWNTTPTFTPNFGNFGGFGFGNSLWNPSLGTKKKSPEEIAKKRDAEIAKLNEQIKQTEALKDQAGQAQAADGTVIATPSLNELKKQYDEAETLEDGTKVTYAKTEQLPFMTKCMRGIGKVTEGLWGTVKSLVGFEPDGSWNWKKCLKNVAITAGCCFAGPIAGTVLTAAGASAGVVSAVTGSIAVASRVAATGMKYYSMYKLGEGVYKGCTAETTKEFDESWQQVGTSAFTLFGAKAIQKGISKVATANCNAANSQAANTAPATTGTTQATTFGDKVWNWTGGKIANGLKQDFSLDSWKTTWKGGYASGEQIHSTIKDAKGQGFVAKAKAYGQALTQDIRAVRNDEANMSKKEFDARMQQNREILDKQINNLGERIKNATGDQKAALEALQKANIDLRNGLDKVATRQDWANLQSQYRASVDQLSSSSSPSWKFWKSRNATQLDQAVIDKQKLVTDSFSDLVKSRVSSIESMAKVSDYKAEVSEFGYSRWNGANRMDNWNLTHPTGGAKFKGVAGFGITYVLPVLQGDLAYSVANPVSNTTGALWWNAQQVVAPTLAATPLEGVDMIWDEKTKDNLDARFKLVDDKLLDLERQKKEVYKKYDNMA